MNNETRFQYYKGFAEMANDTSSIEKLREDIERDKANKELEMTQYILLRRILIIYSYIKTYLFSCFHTLLLLFSYYV